MKPAQASMGLPSWVRVWLGGLCLHTVVEGVFVETVTG